MKTLRAVTLVALATGLTFVVGEASAQYYPSGPAYPPAAVGPRMGPPMPVDADDPDYAPPRGKGRVLREEKSVLADLGRVGENARPGWAGGKEARSAPPPSDSNSLLSGLIHAIHS